MSRASSARAAPDSRARRRRPAIGIALAGGAPFGAAYEIGALLALEESIEGLELHDLDCYVGVSAGGVIAAALANGIPIREIHETFVAGGNDLVRRVLMRPALAEYLRRLRLLPRAALRSARARSLAPLGCVIPTGLLDNEAMHAYLAETFSARGRTNDFRRLRRRLFVVATDLDTGESVSFGRDGHDRVPISKAVQASAALPGLFPPVEIDGRFYVDGALRKTLHASEALDAGMKLVLCVNPIVPYAARNAVGIAQGGLPAVLSQTFRALIHSRLALGLSKYRTQYRGSDVLLFEPAADDALSFFSNPFGYSNRRALCEHARRSTRRDLLRRAEVLEPILARHGLRLRARRLRRKPAAAA